MSDEDDRVEELVEHLRNAGVTDMTEEVLATLTVREAMVLRKKFGISKKYH